MIRFVGALPVRYIWVWFDGVVMEKEGFCERLHFISFGSISIGVGENCAFDACIWMLEGDNSTPLFCPRRCINK